MQIPVLRNSIGFNADPDMDLDPAFFVNADTDPDLDPGFGLPKIGKNLQLNEKFKFL